MKEKAVAIFVVACMETIFVTACATAGCLFADCIKMKIHERVIRKELKKEEGKN